MIRGQASTVRAVATCRISAACSSDWEASTGVKKPDRDKFAASQPAECAPGSTEGSSKREDPEDPSIIGSSSARGQRGAAGIAHRFGEGQTTSRGAFCGATDSRHGGQSEETSLATPMQHCCSQRGVAQSRTRQRESMWKVSPTREERPLEEVEDTSCRSEFAGAIADPGGEVAQLQQVVADLQRQLQQHAAPVVPAQGVSPVPSISPSRIRKREDCVRATEHEVLEWMTDRQEEMTAALIARNPTEAARISSLITDATRSLQPEVLPSMVTNMVPVRIAQEARTISRYGLRGSRVGEASNPGPPHLRRLRRASQSKDWPVTSFLG